MAELFDDLPDHPARSAGGGGAPRLRRAERSQVELRPASLDELLPPDHPACMVWAAVGRFDLSPLLDRIVAREGIGGHPATDPAILLALWLYATIDGVGSARELARLCQSEIAYRWLCGGVSMNHHSLSDFRVDHADWLDAELTRSIAGLLASGIVGFEQVAQDGLRIRASAGVNSFRKLPSLVKAQRLAEQQVRTLRQELEADPAVGSRRRQAARQRAAADRLARVEAALAAMDEAQARKRRNKGKAEAAKVSTTDPQARIMRMPDGGFRPAYNLQLAAETEHSLVVGLAVSCSGADQDNLLPMAEQVAQRYGRRPAHWLADGGYAGKGAIEALSKAGIAAHIPCEGLAAGAQAESPAIQAWREAWAARRASCATAAARR